MPKELPSPELLRKLLRYNPETGEFFWRKRGREHFTDNPAILDMHVKMWNVKYSGKRAFTSDDGSGYKLTTILSRRFKAHRVAWAMHYGRWPCGDIDHVNGNPSDNRISNLRDVSHRSNMRNMKKHATNTSGACGVSFHKSAGKWMAYIGSGESRIYLGLHDTMHDAKKARSHAEKSLNYHKNHGR